MKKFLSLLLSALLILPTLTLGAAAEEAQLSAFDTAVVYVDEGFTGTEAGTKTAPYKSIANAVNGLGASGGTIVLMSAAAASNNNFGASGNAKTAPHKFTSVDPVSGTDYRTSGAKLITTASMYPQGDLYLENLVYDNSAEYINASGNKLFIGEGVTATLAIKIRGIRENANADSTEIHLNDGNTSVAKAYAIGYGSAATYGDATVYLEGGLFKKNAPAITYGNSGTAGDGNYVGGNANIIVNGADPSSVLYANFTCARVDGALNVVFNNGMLSKLPQSNISVDMGSVVPGKGTYYIDSTADGYVIPLATTVTDNVPNDTHGKFVITTDRKYICVTDEKDNVKYFSKRADNTYDLGKEGYYRITYVDSGVSESTVSFDLNGGTGNVPASVTGIVGDSVDLPDGTGLSKDGCVFLGWSETPDGSPVSEFVLGSSDKTLYAVWQAGDAVTVTLDAAANGGSCAASSVIGVVGGTLTLPEATKSGYTFLGWSLDKDAKAGSLSFTVSSSEVTLYAIFGKVFYVDGTYTGTTRNGAFDTPYTDLKTATNAVGAEAGVVVLKGSVTLTSSSIGGKDGGFVTYTSVDPVSGTDFRASGAALILSSSIYFACDSAFENITFQPTKAMYFNACGYKLVIGKGTQKIAASDGTVYQTTSRGGREDVGYDNTYTEIWTGNDVITRIYAGTYGGVAGINCDSTIVINGGSYNHVTNAVLSLGNSGNSSGATNFIGGNGNVIVNDITSGSALKITATIARIDGAVNYVFNNGSYSKVGTKTYVTSPAPAGGSYVIDSAVGGTVMPVPTTISGETVTRSVGKFSVETDADFVCVNGTDYYPASDGLVLDLGTPGTYTVTYADAAPDCGFAFDLNGAEGTAPETVNGIVGVTVTDLGVENPERPYHNFLGWSVNKNATEPDASFTFTSGVTTLYAVWQEYQKITVAIESNGAECLFTSYETYDGAEITLPILSKPGYVFCGWSMSSADTYGGLTVIAKYGATYYALFGETDEDCIYVDESASVNGDGKSKFSPMNNMKDVIAATKTTGNTIVFVTSGIIAHSESGVSTLGNTFPVKGTVKLTNIDPASGEQFNAYALVRYGAINLSSDVIVDIPIAYFSPAHQEAGTTAWPFINVRGHVIEFTENGRIVSKGSNIPGCDYPCWATIGFRGGGDGNTPDSTNFIFANADYNLGSSALHCASQGCNVTGSVNVTVNGGTNGISLNLGNDMNSSNTIGKNVNLVINGYSNYATISTGAKIDAIGGAVNYVFNNGIYEKVSVNHNGLKTMPDPAFGVYYVFADEGGHVTPTDNVGEFRIVTEKKNIIVNGEAVPKNSSELYDLGDAGEYVVTFCDDALVSGKLVLAREDGDTPVSYAAAVVKAADGTPELSFALEDADTKTGSVPFSFSVSGGKHILEITKKGYIGQRILFTAAGSDLDLGDVEMVGGDIPAAAAAASGDGSVSTDDFVRVLHAMEALAGGTAMDNVADADVNEDGILSVADLAIVKANLGELFTEREIAPPSGIKLVLPDGEIDVVPAAIRGFLDASLSAPSVDYTDGQYESVGMQPIGTYTFRWSFVGFKPAESTIFLATKEDLSDAVSFTTSGTTFTPTYIYTGTRYYWWVEAENGDETVRSEVGTVDIMWGPRMVTVGGSYNCRDMGGWLASDGRRIKEGIVYRTAHLDTLTEAGRSTLLEDFGVKTDLDLRAGAASEYGYLNGVGPLGPTAQFINVSGVNYAPALTASGTKDALKVFADIDNYPIVFHCLGGADRTGTLAVLLEALCGCSEQICVADFELTSGRGRTHTTYGSFAGLMSSLKGYSGATLQDKSKNVMKGLGLTEMEISNIYSILMSDSALFDTSSLAKKSAVSGVRTYKLNMRESEAIESVKVGGASVTWNLSGDTLSVTSASGIGVITFTDGAQLYFE